MTKYWDQCICECEVKSETVKHFAAEELVEKYSMSNLKLKDVHNLNDDAMTWLINLKLQLRCWYYFMNFTFYIFYLLHIVKILF